MNDIAFDFASRTEVGGKELTLDGSNIMYHKDRVEAWARGERVAPIFIDVAWTRRCQAACYFCAAQTQSSEGGVITREHAISFLEDSAEIGVLAMNYISDGESTMVPWYAESVERATDLGIQIGAGTNGIATTKPVLERILPTACVLPGQLLRWREKALRRDHGPRAADLRQGHRQYPHRR